MTSSIWLSVAGLRFINSDKDSHHEIHQIHESLRDFGLVFHFVYFVCFVVNKSVQRSHSPMTKSSEPRIETTSDTRLPTHSLGRMDKLQNEGLRIFIR